MTVRRGNGKKWTPEEDAILLKYRTMYASDIAELLPGRSINSINQRRRILGTATLKPRRDVPHKKNQKVRPDRPITEETAYHIRKDYAAKRKLGYTHERAIKWLVEANERREDIIIDLLENPIYDAQVKAHEQKPDYIL